MQKLRHASQIRIMLSMQPTARVQEEKQAKGVKWVCMNFEFVNWWKYWERGFREIHWLWIGITTDGFMEHTHWIRIDIHLINLGIIIRI